MMASQLVSQEVAACSASDNLDQAAKVMWEQDCGVLVVTDARGQAVAMLTDRDICMAAMKQGKALSEIAVHTLLSLGLVSCHLESSNAMWNR